MAEELCIQLSSRGTLWKKFKFSVYLATILLLYILGYIRPKCTAIDGWVAFHVATGDHSEGHCINYNIRLLRYANLARDAWMRSLVAAARLRSTLGQFGSSCSSFAQYTHKWSRAAAYYNLRGLGMRLLMGDIIHQYTTTQVTNSLATLVPPAVAR